MIEVRKGYDKEAALAMWAAYETEEPETVFCERARKSGLFFGLYDGTPVGALLFDGPFVHTAILPEVRGRAYGAFEFCLRWALARIPYLVAYVTHENVRAQRLVEIMGFKPFGANAEHFLYVRRA